MNGGGYGICGHKNSYNAGVKDGNWVEDKIGQDLAANRPRPKQTITSELRSSYIDPVCMPWKQSIEVVVADTQNRKGLNKDVLFNHGADIFASDDDFPSSDSCKRLMRARSDILQKEQYQIDFRSSEAKEANSLVQEIVFRVPRPSNSATLPNFRRKSTFSRGELLDR